MYNLGDMDVSGAAVWVTVTKVGFVEYNGYVFYVRKGSFVKKSN